jgi:hypothetical protein
VVLSLPFLATHVTFDDEQRDLSPATDVTAFDVPAESGQRHRIAAVALDGTRAEGTVREEDGIARPDSDGYVFIPAEPVGDARAPYTGRPARPIGTVHNGFTKLR